MLETRLLPPLVHRYIRLEEGEKVEERAGYGESYSAENIEGRF